MITLNKRGFLLILFVSMVLVPPWVWANDVTIVKVHGQMPTSHFLSKAMEMIIKDAEFNSKDTLKFQYYPAQQLFKAEQIQDILGTAGVDIAMLDFYKLAGKIPQGLLTTPCFVDMDWYFRWFYDTSIRGGFYYNALFPAFEKRNMYLFGTLNYTPSLGVISTKPITKVTDYKGLKIRTGGKSLGAIVEAFGGKVAVLSSADVYMAIQRQTVDGSLSAPSSITSRKWYEIANYYHDLGTGNMPLGIAANLGFWKKLTESQRNVLKNATRKAELWCIDESLKEDSESLELMKKGKVTINQLPKNEMDKMVEIGLAAVRESVISDVKEINWNTAMELRNNTRTGKATAKELIQTRLFPEFGKAK
jgi:C4-dicarboxylate-binding protein DctP